MLTGTHADFLRDLVLLLLQKLGSTCTCIYVVKQTQVSEIVIIAVVTYRMLQPGSMEAATVDKMNQQPCFCDTLSRGYGQKVLFVPCYPVIQIINNDFIHEKRKLPCMYFFLESFFPLGFYCQELLRKLKGSCPVSFLNLILHCTR